MNEPPPAVAATHPDLGSEIDPVMTRALAKAPGERYESGGELVAAARAALGLPELAPSTTSASQARAHASGSAEGSWPHSSPRATAVVLVAVLAGALFLRGSDGLSGIGPTSVGVIDPSTAKLVADIPLGFESSLIAAGEGFIWVLNAEASTLTRIDPDTMEVVAPRGIPS